jgi:hypothetical protein
MIRNRRARVSEEVTDIVNDSIAGVSTPLPKKPAKKRKSK